MKVVTKYISILGREFDNPEDAQADEDRLPSIIATYEKDLAKQVVGGTYGKDKVLTAEMVAKNRPLFQDALDDYKAKWAEVQAQRGAPFVTYKQHLEKIRDLALAVQGYAYDGSPFKSVTDDKQVYAFSRMAQVDRQRIIKIEAAARKALASLT